MQITITASSVAELKYIVDELCANKPEIKIIEEKPEEPRIMFRKNKAWTNLEIENLIHWYNTTTFKTSDMARSLERPSQAVSAMLYKLKKEGIIKNRSNRPSKVKTSSLT